MPFLICPPIAVECRKKCKKIIHKTVKNLDNQQQTPCFLVCEYPPRLNFAATMNRNGSNDDIN